MVQQPNRAVESAIVYEAKNLVNGHRYIGFTCQGLARREWQHRQSVKARTGSTKLKAALVEFGQENFVFSVLADFAGDEELALIYEAEAIEKYRPEYNLRGGGQSGGSIAMETRKKMSDVQKGRPSPLRGVPLSAAHKLAISKGHLGIKRPPEVMQKLRAGLKAWVPTEAQRTRQREIILAAGLLLKRPVMCLDDGKVFPSCTAADIFYGLRRGYASAKAIKNAKGMKNRKGPRFKFLPEVNNR